MNGRRHAHLVAVVVALALAPLASGGESAVPTFFTEPSAPVPAEACGDTDLGAVLAGITPAGDQAVWTHHDGCHAQLTCESNCVKSCSGTVCSVGSNYVECDGQKEFCASCNLSEYPGYPECGLRQCPWCVCRSNGGTMAECCAPIGP